MTVTEFKTRFKHWDKLDEDMVAVLVNKTGAYSPCRNTGICYEFKDVNEAVEFFVENNLKVFIQQE